MILPTKIYQAKLLIFGEYTVTMGSGALAKPFSMFSGHWSIASLINQYTESLIYVAEKLKNDQTLASIFDTQRFREEIDQGLVFDSNIPEGYGLGSSGALVAAIYDRFALTKTADLKLLKQILAATENMFHGNSSGIDPLVSYLNKPVLIESTGDITKVDKNLPCPGFFVVDTKLPRKTEPLVQWFKEEMNTHPSFKSKVNLLASINQQAIVSVLNNDLHLLSIQMKQISKIQSTLFQKLIPDNFRLLWQNGIESEKYYMKICGAGGGGMMLGYAQDRNFILESFADYDVTFVE